MATAKHLMGLIKSHLRGDDSRFFTVALQIAAAEARRGHTKVAEDLKLLVDEGRSSRSAAKLRPGPVPIVTPRGELADLMGAGFPKTRLNHMILDDELRAHLRRILQEQKQRWKLREHGLAPRRKLLLVGPPGSGKTMTAATLAGELNLPLYSVLLHGVITKFMGETAAKLRLVFDAMGDNRGVYLFDEFDAIGGKRSNDNDVGEARRVLNSFLQFLEQDESDSIVIATTNHPELLDRALFRRFDAILEYRLPDEQVICEALKGRLTTFNTDAIDWKKAADKAAGLSHAEVIHAAEDAARSAILDHDGQLCMQDLLDAIVARRRGTI